MRISIWQETAQNAPPSPPDFEKFSNLRTLSMIQYCPASKMFANLIEPPSAASASETKGASDSASLNKRPLDIKAVAAGFRQTVDINSIRKTTFAGFDAIQVSMSSDFGSVGKMRLKETRWFATNEAVAKNAALLEWQSVQLPEIAKESYWGAVKNPALDRAAFEKAMSGASGFELGKESEMTISPESSAESVVPPTEVRIVDAVSSVRIVPNDPRQYLPNAEAEEVSLQKLLIGCARPDRPRTDSIKAPELSDEQKAMYAEQSAAKYDVPGSVLDSPDSDMGELSRNQPRPFSVSVLFYVNDKGEFQNCRPFSKPEELGAKACALGKRWTFQPAKKDGKSVDSVIPFTVQFH
jgi:hypothetical protein